MAKNKNFLKNILDTKNQLICLKMYIKLLTQTKKMNYELVDIINNASIDLKNDINTLATDDEISRLKLIVNLILPIFLPNLGH